MALGGLWMVLLVLAWVVKQDPSGHGEGASPSTVWGNSLIVLLPMLTSWVGVRLIGHDLSNGSWSFVCSLPVPRLLQMVAPIAFGAAWTVAVCATSYAYVSVGDVPTSVLWVDLLRLSAGALAWWGFGVMVGSTGRYRWPFSFVALIFLMLASNLGFSVAGFGPIRVFKEDLGLTSRVPHGPILASIASAALLLLLSLALLSVRGGALAAGLARRMTRREQFGVATLAIWSTYIAVSWVSSVPDPSYADTAATKLGDAHIRVAIVKGDSAETSALSERVLGDLRSLAAILEVSHLPRVALEEATHMQTVPWKTLDLGDAAGIGLFYNPKAPGYRERDLSAQAMARAMFTLSDGVLNLEHLHWLAVGFAQHLAWRDAEDQDAGEMRAAAMSRDVSVDLSVLMRSTAASDAMDDETYSVLAGLVVSDLIDQVGEEAVVAELRRWTSPSVGLGLAGRIRYAWREPLGSLERLGVSAQVVDQRLSARLATLREQHADALTKVPYLQPISTADDLGSDVRRVVVRLDDGGILPDTTRLRLRSLPLGRLDEPVHHSEGQTRRVSAKAAREGVTLTGAWRSGERVAVAFEYHDPTLDSRLRGPWLRTVLP